MALFTYHATDASGNYVKGAIEAKDKNAIVDKLQGMGYFPIRISRSIEEIGGRVRDTKFKPFGRRISARNLVDFTQNLSDMVEAGLPLDRSLLILSELESNEAFNKVLLDIYNSVQGGSTLADALEEHPDIFSDIYVNTVRAGEAGGSLDIILARLKNFMEDAQRLKDDIKSALIYPLLLTAVGGSAVMLMLIVFIPKFSIILEDMGGTMPLPTQILLGISGAITGYWYVGLGVTAAGALLLRSFMKTAEGRVRFDRLKLVIPLFGPIVKKASVSRFTRTLGVLMQGGLPILDSLSIAVRTMGNAFLARGLTGVIDGVRKGRGLSEPLREVASFPPLAVHMIAVGEETGRLDETLIRLSDKYDRDVNTAVKRLLSVLEPAIILVMAVVVGFVVISLLLAVFSLNEMPM